MMVVWFVRRRSWGYEGHIAIHLNPGAVEGGGRHQYVAAAHGPHTGETRARALTKAAIVARRAIEPLEELAEHPDRHPAAAMAASMLAPGALPAIMAIQSVAKAGAMGDAMHAVEHLGGAHHLRQLASIF